MDVDIPWSAAILSDLEKKKGFTEVVKMAKFQKGTRKPQENFGMRFYELGKYCNFLCTHAGMDYTISNVCDCVCWTSRVGLPRSAVSVFTTVANIGDSWCSNVCDCG